ncbi:hypothetical protein BJX61DRAFT_541009 [Aspergillus egyptiacus]|nr:hypothetical protein BJX61DRAFT_541009 [Aspergillus egyptiacus]
MPFDQFGPHDPVPGPGISISQQNDDWTSPYTVTQTGEQASADDLLVPETDGYNIRELDWWFGLLKTGGFVDQDNYGLRVLITISGIKVGILDGSLKDGLHLNVDLYDAKGTVLVYLKNGTEVWTKFDLQSVSENYKEEREFKMLSI